MISPPHFPTSGRRIRRSLSYALVLLQGVIAFLGHAGLHALPGAPHHNCCQHAKSPTTESVACQTKSKCKCGHQHASRPPSQADNAPANCPGHDHSAPANHSDEDGCFVCQMAIHRGIVTAPVQILVQSVLVAPFVEVQSPVGPIALKPIHLIRGPPAETLA